MSGIRVLGIILLVLGILALVYRGFTYTKEEHTADIGPLEFKVKDKERVTIPIWLGIVLAGGGGALMLVGSKKE